MDDNTNTFSESRFETLRQMHMDAMERRVDLREVMTKEEIEELLQGYPVYHQMLRARVEAAKEAGRKRMAEIQRLMAVQAQREQWQEMPI